VAVCRKSADTRVLWQAVGYITCSAGRTDQL
jgi:hypothetical protein